MPQRFVFVSEKSGSFWDDFEPFGTIWTCFWLSLTDGFNLWIIVDKWLCNQVCSGVFRCVTRCVTRCVSRCVFVCDQVSIDLPGKMFQGSSSVKERNTSVMKTSCRVSADLLTLSSAETPDVRWDFRCVTQTVDGDVTYQLWRCCCCCCWALCRGQSLRSGCRSWWCGCWRPGNNTSWWRLTERRVLCSHWPDRPPCPEPGSLLWDGSLRPNRPSDPGWNLQATTDWGGIWSERREIHLKSRRNKDVVSYKHRSSSIHNNHRNYLTNGDIKLLLREFITF